MRRTTTFTLAALVAAAVLPLTLGLGATTDDTPWPGPQAGVTAAAHSTVTPFDTPWPGPGSNSAEGAA
ncbi:hypothetical protein ACWFR5_08385 [Streptomyces sp. NPDC055092]